MFTGIVTHKGSVMHIEGSRVRIATENFTQGIAIGASVAVCGICLTVTQRDEAGFAVDVSPETSARTTVGTWRPGTQVNLERSLKAGDELGGHLVSGHVDGVAELIDKKPAGDFWAFSFRTPKELCRFIAEKGSVALDGVSLTVNESKREEFSVMLIPHTLTATTLGSLAVGDKVNLEIDPIARYVARLHER